MAHRAALADAATSALVTALKTKWSRLAIAARAAAVEALIARGCTARGLAADLSVTEGSVRRYVRIARLPAPELERVADGESAKRILAQQRQQQSPAARSPERRGTASETLARWLEQQRLPPCYREQFVDEMRLRAWLSVSRPRGRRRRLRDLRPAGPRPRYGPELLEYLIGWAMSWLISSFQPAERLSVITCLSEHWVRAANS